MNSSSLPLDLTLQILSRLPAKSIARFHCVSKLWASIFDGPHFKELFLTMSSADKSRLLFAIVGDGDWSFFSLPQPHIPYEKPSSSNLVVAADYHLNFPAETPENLRVYHHRDREYFSYGYASGLLYFNGAYQGEEYLRDLICNPNTGGYAMLPYVGTYRKNYGFFMFEPIDKQYKVLSMAYPFCPDKHNKIYTLGSGDMSWRRVKCSLRRHEVKSQGICINGVFYYLGDTSDCVKDADDETPDYVIVCFHIRSEKFTFIDIERLCGLVNYKGKLAVIYWEDGVDIYSEYDFPIFFEDDVDNYSEDHVPISPKHDVDAAASNELHVWILEDVEKQEWSKSAYTLTNDKFSCRDVSLAGMTASGEIVFSMWKYTSEQPFYVFYFNPEMNNLRCVEIQGFGEASKTVYTIVDHVENHYVNDPKLLESFHTPYVVPEYYYSSSDSDSEGVEARDDHWS